MSGFNDYWAYVKLPRRMGAKGFKGVLTRGFTYTSKDGREFKVPCNYETDFATIPRPLWVFITPIGKHTLPAILHDYLYDNGYKMGISRKEADRLFFEAMIDCNVERIVANIMWACVRAFAFNHYNKGK